MLRPSLAAAVAVLVHTSSLAAEVPFTVSRGMPEVEHLQRISQLESRDTPRTEALIPTGWQLEGGGSNVMYGLSTTTVGDVNADGYSDVIVTSAGATSGNGAAHLYLGGAGGLSSSPVWSRTNYVHGPNAAPAGDVNGDGYADFMVGWGEMLGVGAGLVNVYYGSHSGIPTGPFTRQVFNGSLGVSFGTAGDVNGDGYDDVVFGAPNFGCNGTSSGGFEIWYGSAVGLFSGNSAFHCAPLPANSHFGFSVGSAGDINADGYGDVIVGGPDYHVPSGPGQGAGFMAIYLGSPGGLGSTYQVPPIRMTAVQTGCRYGAAVATAGDFNGDGYSDVMVGAPQLGSSGVFEHGSVLIYAGSASPGVTLPSLWGGYDWSFYAHFGASLAPAGDVNGDGYADVAIAAPDIDGTYADQGNVYVLFGRGGAPTNLQTFTGGMTGEHFGYALGTAGDIDGDGFSDLIVGGYGWANPDYQEGRALLYRGQGDAPQLTAGWSSLGAEWFENVGWSVSAAGDVNGDGYGDAIVGAWLYDGPSGYDVGRASIYLGGPSGLAPSPGPDLVGTEWFAAFGFNVARAGDVNGDGYEDVIVGQPYGGIPQAKIFPGGPGGVSGTPLWTGTGAPGSFYGVMVAGAGDVNGDGYADVLVGAPSDDTYGTDSGRAFLYLGGSGGPSTSPSRSFHGNQPGEYFGNALCGAGDLNGDGRSDIAIGAPYYDSGSEIDAGRVDVYFGTSVNVETVPHHSFIYFQSMNGGTKVVGVGDVNGDGYSDLGVSAPAYIFNYVNQGVVYVYAGGPSGLNVNPIWGIVGPEPEGKFGTSFDTAGDVNGDGRSDLLVGSFMLGSQDNGGAYVYTQVGSSVPAWQKYGDNPGDWFAFSVAGAGDVNGDGFSDLLIGAAAAEANGYQDAGKSFLFLGNLTAGDDGLDRRLRIRRSDDSAPIAPRGLCTSSNQIALSVMGRTAAGPSRGLTLEYRLDPNGGGSSVTGAFGPVATTTGPNGATAALSGTSGVLQAGKPYEVRVRVRSKSPYFPFTPWMTPVLDGAEMMDLRTRPGATDAPVAGGEGALEFASPFPNPSRGAATLAFTLPSAGNAKLAILDVAGREIARIADGEFAAGPNRLSWNGADAKGQAAPAGIYFAKLVTAQGEKAQRLVRMP